MNNQNNRRPPVRQVGGAAERNVQQQRRADGVSAQQRDFRTSPNGRPAAQINSEQMIREARMYAGVAPGYTQMPLRPMTSMPKERPQAQRGQQRPAKRPPQQRPAAPQGQRRPPAQGQGQPQRPPQQRPAAPQGQRRPPVQGQGQPQRPPQQRPVAPQGQRRPPVQGQGQPQRPPQQRPVAPQGQRRPPVQGTRARQQRNGWVVPEGSPVYTAEGRVYGVSQKTPSRDPRINGQGKAPQGRGSEQKRPNSRKKKNTFNKKKFFHGVKTFFVRLLTMLIIVSLVGFWWYRVEFYSHSKSRSGNVSYYMEDVGSYETKASVAYKNDVLYVDFTEVSQWFGMVSVGSINSMRFICTEQVSETSSGKGGEEYAIFTSGSATVIVNGISVSLEDVCRTVDYHIWVPLSFVEGYISGIVCERDAAGDDVTFSLEGASEETENEEKTEKQEMDISFKVKGQTAIAPVAYPE